MACHYKKINIPASNYDSSPILVKFLVLHYTACSLEEALKIFQTEKSKLSSHLMIGEGGEVLELVSCLKEKVFKAYHAGKSFWPQVAGTGQKTWENFNDFSIGIELVNKNGNLFEYTSAQYTALNKLLNFLKKKHPALHRAERILGHEHIAGHRGKLDPGCLFDWNRFFKMNYSSSPFPERLSQIDKKQAELFLQQEIKKGFNSEQKEGWDRFSLKMENYFKA